MRLLPRSLFGRMFALSLLATLAALAVAGVVIGGVLERFVTGGIDARLGDRLIALESAVRADGTLDRARLSRLVARLPVGEPWRIETAREVLGGNGDLVPIDRQPRRPLPPPNARPPNAPRPDVSPPNGRPPPLGPAASPFPDGGGTPFDGVLRDGMQVHGLVASIATARDEVRIAVAVPRDQIDRPVRAALVPLAVSLAVLGLALGSAALLQLRIGLRPLTALRAAVEAIRRGETTRVADDMPDELAPLAHELNALAADNAAALGNARAAAANLAHALKTPVATLALHFGADPIARSQIDRIDATLRHHLGRARAGAVDRRSVTAIAPALAGIVTAVGTIHRGRVRLDVDAADGISAAVDPQDFDEIAGNLIDNAARHAAGAVTIAVSTAGRSLVLAVADDGAGIAPADRDRATAPGVRLDERTDGHGFGLSIVRELAELYGGALTLGVADGGGLLATVTLPLARPA
ncbi:HAMP domain-containing histidine kinase [Sphingomonas sp. NBWT7]|uniref:sensor histidine kinase n=1 Tax=Sphingomonas sp. NBWT7 TaxID=2596913 RepID=UPI001629F23C|nr:HAMP domain-containing sensor histidine kinase [Sphingomonas sp. NBWT7]QNE32398.1 HAMP domain-containing histidine kinase [Sphingomonas sp. NBWT7]